MTDFECQQCFEHKSTDGRVAHSFHGPICADCATENREELGDEDYERSHEEYVDD